jgi:hypothetical protein
MFMLKTGAVALLSIPLVLLGLVAATGLVVVDVKPSDGPRIVVPVPLVLAHAALGFAPEQAREVQVPELGQYASVAKRLLGELRSIDDAVLVEVDDGSDHVVIEKVGDELAIEVDSDGDEVSVRLPLSGAAKVVESYDEGGRLQVAGLLDALSSSSSLSGTDLVHVKSADEEVRVWIW